VAFDNLERIGQVWYASMHVPDDVREALNKRRLRKTLKTTDKRVALFRARVVVADWWDEIHRARRELRGQLDPLTQEALTWREEYRKQSAPEDVLQGAVMDRAEQLQEKHGEATASAFYRVAIGKATPIVPLVEQWIAYAGKTIKGKTLAMYKSDTLRMAETLPHLEDLTNRKVRDWLWGLASNTGDGMAEGTQRRILNGLSSFWKWCHTQNLVPEDATNPFIGQPLFRGAVQVKRLPFSDDGVVKTWAAALEKQDQPLADLIYLGAYTGARIEELCLVKVRDVDPKLSSFKIADAKTAAGIREVPVHSRLKSTLKRLMKDSKDGYLIPSTAKNNHGKRSDPLGKRFGRLKTDLGYGREVVFHSIRKTVATQLENAGVPEGVAADILGHEKQTMTYGLYSGGTSLANKAKAIEHLAYAFPR
jgi:integrase